MIARSAARGCAASLVLASLLFPAWTIAAPAPDAGALGALRTRAARFNRFRVVTPQAEFELTALRVDPAGVRLPPEARRPSIASDLTPPEPRLVEWPAIQRIEGRRVSALSGAAQGMIVGGILGLTATVLIASNVQDESALAAIGITPTGVLFGGIAGAWLGSGGKWRPIWP